MTPIDIDYRFYIFPALFLRTMSRRSIQTFECGHCAAAKKPYKFPNADLLNLAKEEAKRRSAKCKGQNGRCGNLLEVNTVNLFFDWFKLLKNE